MISLAVNILFIILRFAIFGKSRTRATYLLYFALSSPAFAIEFWFEKIGRPTNGPNGDLQKSGEDLEAEGLTEFMWDVLYWSWGCIAIVSLLGDKAWWLWAVIPLYSAWLAYTTFGSVRQGMAGLTGQGGRGSALDGGATSKRQKKLEKRGGLKMHHR